MNPNKFCKNGRNLYNTPESNEVCDYPEVPEPIQGNQPIAINHNQTVNKPPVSLKPIYGTITNITINYNQNQPECIANYDLTVATSDQQEAHFILSSNTYFVDCLLQVKGINVVGFYDELAPMPYIYPPRYQIIVFALNLPGRYVKADFFDCYLLSSDHTLQLVISNNTYIVDEEGTQYCGNISNKYMVVLYSNATNHTPAITKPNVIIVLN